MILLKGHSLQQARRVPLEAMSLKLTERDSTADITPADMTGITVGAWLQDDTEPGKGIVWRVKSISETWATKTPRVQLEHAVSLLKDEILFGEHKAAEITGNAKATTCTAAQAIRYILSRSADWELGRCDYTVSNPYRFDGDSLMDALEIVSNSLADSWWTYDFSTYPFKLNIIKKSTGVGTVLRCGRNITAIARSIDRSGMFTRFYPIGKNDLHLPGGGYAEKNTAAYGVVSKVETDQSLDSEDELRRWANERLALHAEPVVTIEVDALELSAATGESVDKLKLGEKCRVTVSEYGSEITETITQITYNDKLHAPEAARITLANNRTDITKILAENLKKGGKGGRGSARKEKEDNAWFEDTNEHVAMCAKGIIGVDAKGEPNWIRLTNLVADGEGLHSTVTEIQNGQILHQTRLDQNERHIGLVVETTDGEARIKAGEICLAINESNESEATIDAKKIYLLGQTIANTVTANFVASRISAVNSLNVNNMTAGSIRVATGGSSSLVATEAYVNGCPYNLRITQSGDTYTLQWQRLGSTGWSDVGSFSRATSLSGAWSGGRFTVTASPQGKTKYTDLTTQGHWGYAQSENVNTYYGGVSATIDGGSTSHSTGTWFEVDASGRYNAGRDETEVICSHNQSAEISGTVNLDWNQTYAVYAGFQKSDGTWEWTKAYNIHGKALPTISNVGRTNSPSGTSAGNVASREGAYVTFSMGGSNYYIRIE